MRKVILVATFGLCLGIPLAPAAMMPVAHAQSVSEQQSVQAQLIALAQAGNWADFQGLVNRQLASGKAAMLATIAGNISTMGLGIVDSDPSTSVALSLAAISIADNSSVVASNPDLGSLIGNNAGQVKAKIVRRSPAGAAALASAVARNSAPGMMIAYNSGQSSSQQTGSTNTAVVRVVRQNPPVPDTPELPIIPEPNPEQSGSPT
ncbi:hypothetical protein [Gimibacter soli]|uniref:Uncharacterized protein n=1 Tax=Gimibacter soli TaxID=3024400 RepID=A0AAE9XKI5_9PROT|nr:hypothetical protein [Gimibacter soli]WCL52617.1 hypothetical protein PH603_08705 [Gimibacter soli]